MPQPGGALLMHLRPASKAANKAASCSLSRRARHPTPRSGEASRQLARTRQARRGIFEAGARRRRPRYASGPRRSWRRTQARAARRPLRSWAHFASSRRPSSRVQPALTSVARPTHAQLQDPRSCLPIGHRRRTAVSGQTWPSQLAAAPARRTTARQARAQAQAQAQAQARAQAQAEPRQGAVGSPSPSRLPCPASVARLPRCHKPIQTLTST